MSEHEQLEESVASWLLGAVEADEAETLRTHIEACSTCGEMASRLGGAVDLLPLVVDEVAPPAHLRERILAAAAASSRSGLAPNRTPARRRSPATYARRFDLRVLDRLPAYAVAAAVILALVVGVAAGEVASRRPTVPAPSQLARFTLTGHDALAGATASVIDLKGDGVALVDFKGLPSLAPGKVYELWLITSSSRADPAGVFVPDSNGTRVLVVSRTLAGYVTMAVTTEQGPDGATAPSVQPQMSGSLA